MNTGSRESAMLIRMNKQTVYELEMDGQIFRLDECDMGALEAEISRVRVKEEGARSEEEDYVEYRKRAALKVDPGSYVDVEMAIAEGDKIRAVKAYRSHTFMSLADCKDRVEKWAAEHGFIWRGSCLDCMVKKGISVWHVVARER